MFQEMLQSEGIELNDPVPVPSDPYLTLRNSLVETPNRDSDLKDILGIREGSRGYVSKGLPTARLLRYTAISSIMNGYYLIQVL